ncbi:MAG: GrdX family protein [Clostridia bacterium]
MGMRCLTNNPSIIEKHLPMVEVLNGSTLELFLRVRSEMLLGYQLITHPLTGSIGPDKSPYKSVILSIEKGVLDPESYSIIEKAIEYTKTLTANQQPFLGDTASLEDYAMIDYEFVKAFLTN